MSINNISQGNNYHTALNISNLIGSRKYNIKVEFKTDTNSFKHDVYIMDNGLAYYFEVDKTALKLKKITPNQLLKRDNNLTQISYISNPKQLLDTTKTDTLTKKNTAYIPPFTTYYKMENYAGKIGCAWPIQTEELTTIKKAINTQTLEDSKLENAKGRIQYMDSICITVNQLREVLILFEYEETKLDFAKYIAPNIFDIDNIGKLNDVFNFKNSIDELKEVINNNN